MGMEEEKEGGENKGGKHKECVFKAHCDLWSCYHVWNCHHECRLSLINER